MSVIPYKLAIQSIRMADWVDKQSVVSSAGPPSGRSLSCVHNEDGPSTVPVIASQLDTVPFFVVRHECRCDMRPSDHRSRKREEVKALTVVYLDNRSVVAVDKSE